MIRKILPGIVFCIILMMPIASNASLYIGTGIDYSVPQSANFKAVNNPTLGGLVQIENRDFCNLWYGLRVDFVNYKKANGVDSGYYNSAVNISPEVRYNLLSQDCYKNVALPYLQAMFTISSIGGTDNASRIGLGGALGFGVLVPFRLFNYCWSIDLNAQYVAPNFIYSDPNRTSIESLNLSLTLGIGL